ncbi:MAG: cupin domain-containing protein [Planctomycetales bacterium]|nr:cupin domain-containing protein [Planctomycetales bacterium]
MPPRYQFAELGTLPPTTCPCGTTRRAFTEDPDQVASMHIVEISANSRTHYHKQMTELYYVLEGTGQMELDGQLFDVQPGTAILIKPLCRHRAIGKLKILNVPVPAFDPQDEWFDDDSTGT